MKQIALDIDQVQDIRQHQIILCYPLTPCYRLTPCQDQLHYLKNQLADVLEHVMDAVLIILNQKQLKILSRPKVVR